MLAFAAIQEGATAMANPLLLPLLNWARKLRYPTLFKLTAALFAFSVLLPPGVAELAPNLNAETPVKLGQRLATRL